LVTPAAARMASRSALRKPERYISSKAACNRSARVRSEFRDVARLPCDRFLIADIPISMHVHTGRCRAEQSSCIVMPNKCHALSELAYACSSNLVSFDGLEIDDLTWSQQLGDLLLTFQVAVTQCFDLNPLILPFPAPLS
jgi:hypothetical protein